MKQSFTQPADSTPKAKSMPETLADLYTSAYLHAIGAVGVLVFAGWLAQETGITALAWLGLTATIPALRAVVIWRKTGHLSEQMIPTPKRERKPSHWLRIWWWLRSRPPRVKSAREPFRRVRVGDADEVLMPRQPSEMRAETEPAIIKSHGYTASDVYFVVCRASNVGLSERATDKHGQPVWQFGDGQRLVLPSGAQLSRAGFRAVQAYLVEHGHAVAKPNYAMTATPEAILEAM